MKRAEHALEYLDRPVAPADRDASLADVDRLNTWFGGYWLTLRAIARVQRVRTTGGPLVVVDVGGGRGDFARRLRRWARRRHLDIRIVIVDRDAIVSEAGLCGIRADATALPVRDGAADVVTTSLMLHHLEPEAAVRCLAEMRAAARGAVVVNDLWRTWWTLALVWLATRLFTRHHFAWHDGPLSVRRAYAPRELRQLAEKAGITNLVIRRYPWLGRLLAVSA